MRHHSTETEQALWCQLAGSALGVAFKRQVPIDRYIVDFLAPARKLVVEVDGGVHSVRRTRDARRDRLLQRLGYRVLRVEAELVRTNITEAVALIVAAVRAL
jgi:very-short-patch-repair endonuclease